MGQSFNSLFLRISIYISKIFPKLRIIYEVQAGKERVRGKDEGGKFQHFASYIKSFLLRSKIFSVIKIRIYFYTLPLLTLVEGISFEYLSSTLKHNL